MSNLSFKMDFFTSELRDKPFIGIVSGLLSWIIFQINTSVNSGFFSDQNPFWNLLSKFGIVLGVIIALLTVAIKLKEALDKWFPKKG